MKFQLDYKIWRCGSDGPHRLGEGATQLLNSDGFMCCLGQFCSQIGIDSTHLYDVGEPECIEPAARVGQAGMHDIDEITGEAMAINDDWHLPLRHKVESLCGLLRRHGHELELVNFPETFE